MARSFDHTRLPTFTQAHPEQVGQRGLGALVAQVLLAEGFGVSDSAIGYFLDDGQSGLLGTIDRLTAATASAGLRPENATIAAHSNHVLFLLDLFMADERGEQPSADWAGSWTVQTVDAAAWDALRANVRALLHGRRRTNQGSQRVAGAGRRRRPQPAGPRGLSHRRDQADHHLARQVVAPRALALT